MSFSLVCLMLDVVLTGMGLILNVLHIFRSITISLYYAFVFGGRDRKSVV